MPEFMPRTDLAVEAHSFSLSSEGSPLPGAELRESPVQGLKCQILEITTEEAEKKLGKPRGLYYTLKIQELLHRETEAFEKTVGGLAELLKGLLPPAGSGTVLVACLGNRDITPDALGPLCAESLLITRHLKTQLPKDFAAFESVCTVTPGVLGTSGIESADHIKAVTELVRPCAMIVVDALCAGSMETLCRTVQITDTGISPGSGVGNSRAELSKKIMGVPVIAVGVPTVVEVRSILSGHCPCPAPTDSDFSADMIVTPRSIDNMVSSMARAVAYGINMALHRDISLADIDMLL